MDNSSWQMANDRYLSAALAWLRLLLAQKAEGYQEQNGPADSPATVSKEAVAEAAAALVEAEKSDPSPALMLLGQLFNLSDFEQKSLLLCAAMELDTGIAGLCARAQDNSERTYPTFALALSLFEDSAWDVLSPERPLRYWQLIEVNQPSAQPLWK